MYKSNKGVTQDYREVGGGTWELVLTRITTRLSFQLAEFC